MAKSMALDFTNVAEGGGSFRKTRYPAGDYLGKIIKVQDAKSKEDKKPMWLFSIQVKAGIYPYYCKFQENQLWKIRNLFVAAGVAVPRKKVKVDPSKIVGRNIGVTLDDDEYDGKLQSVVAAVFPPSELDSEDTDEEDEETSEEEEDEEESDDEEDEDEDDDSDSDDEEEDEDEEEEEEDEDEEEEEPAPKKKSKAKVKPAPAKSKAKSKKAKKSSDDDDLEEIDIEDM